MANLYTMERDFFARMGWVWRDWSKIRGGEAQLIVWLNKGEEIVAEALGFPDVEATITTVADQREYDLPSTGGGRWIAGHKVARATYLSWSISSSVVTGSGTIVNAQASKSGGRSETWTITFTSETAFSVSGSISGSQTAPGDVNASYSTDNSELTLAAAFWTTKTWTIGDVVTVVVALNEEVIRERTIGDMDRRYSEWRTDTASADQPTEFYIDWTTRKVGIHPIPDNSGDTLTLVFAGRPTPMRTVYTTGSVTITGDGVEGSGTDWTAGGIAAGMQLGVLEAYGGTETMPVAWDEVESVTDADTLVLTHSAGIDVTGKNYVLADRSSLFGRELDAFGDIPVFYAMSVAPNGKDHRARWEAKFEGLVGKLEQSLASVRGQDVRFDFADGYWRGADSPRV